MYTKHLYGLRIHLQTYDWLITKPFLKSDVWTFLHKPG